MWMVGVVVAVSVAAAALVMTNKLVYGPTGQVREYFHALRTGNGSYARGLLGAQIPEGDASLLDGDALRRSVSSLGEVSYDSTVYTAQKVNEVVTAQDANHAVRMELKPSDNALSSVKEQVQNHLKKCTQQSTLYPGGCPFEYAFTGRVDSEVKWSVVKVADPQVSVSSAGVWSLKPMSGTAKVSFTQLDLFTGARSQVQKEIPFTLKASVEADAKAVRVSV